jgi:transcriptional regulator with XRE-family HTH domain
MSPTDNVAGIPLQRTRAKPYGLSVANAPNTRGEQFARLIRDGRARTGLSQDLLADQAGLNRSTIIRWESGDASRPDPDQVRSVCKILGIDPQQAAMALGYLRPEDLPPPGAGRPLDERILRVIEALEDPQVPESEKQEWVKYLMYLRRSAQPDGSDRQVS